MQRGIQRAGFDLQYVGRLGADRLRDRVAMLRAPLQRAKDQHVERAMQEIGARIGTGRVKSHGP